MEGDVFLTALESIRFRASVNKQQQLLEDFDPYTNRKLGLSDDCQSSVSHV